MKTKWISSHKSSRYYPALAVVILVTCIGCTKEPPVPPTPGSLAAEKYLDLRVVTEQYWVDPEGTTINAFNGGVILDFPEGVVNEPTLVNLASFPLDGLEREGYHLMDRGFSITRDSEYEPISSSLNHYVKIKISFDSNLLAGRKGTMESAFTIFYLNHYGSANERIELMSKCTRDISGNSFNGCLYCCGTYVVGES